MDRVLEGYFLGFCCLEGIFFGFSVSGKVFFGGRSEIPNFADPCVYVWQVHPLGSNVEVMRLSSKSCLNYYSMAIQILRQLLIVLLSSQQ